MWTAGMAHPLEIGTVRVRLSGMVESDEKGRERPSVAVPTASEAALALQRTARVSGADRVVHVGTDYRRIAIARGLLAPRTLIEVQAWGTAVRQD